MGEPKFYLNEYEGEICHGDGKEAETFDEQQVVDMLNDRDTRIAALEQQVGELRQIVGRLSLALVTGGVPVEDVQVITGALSPRPADAAPSDGEED